MKPGLTVLGLGTFLAILGPFNSDSLGWPWVWVYWIVLMGFGAVFGWASGIWLERKHPDLPHWAQAIINAAMISIPITIAVVLLNGWLNRGIDWAIAPLTFFYALVISLFATFVVMAAERLRQRSAPPHETPRASAALLDKLPVKLRTASIYAMQSEDHYLRVFTQAGEAMILMRLSDAVAACEMLEGMRTHRSWWVAQSAIEDVERGDGRAVLTLKNGTRVPVSRTYYPKIREAGWI